MSLLIIGLAAFFAAHLSPLAPSIRRGIVGSVGEGGYKGAFAIVSAIGLALIVVGYRMAGATELLYYPLAQAIPLAHMLMPFAFILLAGAHMRSNLKRYARHPMSLGVLLWALVHLAANGELADVLLFGSFAAFAIVDMVAMPRATATPPPQPRSRDMMVVVAGLVAYGAVFFIHNQIVPISG